MKSIGKLKITQLSKAELGKRELNRLVGGERCCTCGCRPGGSSSSDVTYANYGGGSSGLHFGSDGSPSGSYS
ncbi:TIGR04149 family rSAM-modified RiPP [Parabacteroides hominis]|uniref:RSAM-modified peptide n=1 Tax=Parabacteroides hominis TaxID=2763057 RepID=A0ABR7DR18_9BACT|nr:TIGR04149 family rSAM-modified RiPP [Parabacteroides hominis]MBC5633879.1 rSAM-modified peptide [Parabacteroides hominis]